MGRADEPFHPPLDVKAQALRVAGMLGVSFLVWADIAQEQLEQVPAYFWTDLAVGLLCMVVVQWRRRWPLAIAVVVTLANAVSASAAGPATLALVSLSTHRRVPQIVAVGLLGLMMPVVFRTYQPVNSETGVAFFDFAYYAGITAGIAALGMYLGTRRELFWMMRERAERAEAEQETRVAAARSEEREQIAREMHDVLAHRISLVTMHAGALAYRSDLSPEEVQASATIVQQKAGEALQDLRQVLGVLRDDEASTTRPQPTYADVPSLVDESRAAGMQVDFSSSVAEGIPEQLGRTVYRVVQEGLTNVRKHAPHAHATVTIVAEGDCVVVTVWNATSVGYQTSAPSSGMGLVGLSERVHLAGGRLTTRSDVRGFTLRAELPRKPA